MLRKHIFTFLFLGWATFITVLSLFSFDGIEQEGIKIPNADKIAHFIFYGTFVVLGYFAVRERMQKQVGDTKILLIFIALAVLYGMVLEGLQHVMPFNRAAEIGDALANTFGALLGGLLTKTYLLLGQRPKSPN